MTNVKLNLRLGLLTAVTVLLAILLGGKLYRLQTALEAVYPASAEKTYVTETRVAAARGEILDRYGRPLVLNRMTLSIKIDRNLLLRAESPARTVLKLIKAAQRCGAAYNDTFPVTGPPYAFVSPMSQAQTKQLDQFLQKKGWEPMDADAFMAALCEEYRIPSGFTLEERRLVTGVLYELELRALYTTVAPYAYIAPYVFAEDAGMDLVSYIKEQNLPGCLAEMTPARVYQTEAAAHILGRVGQIPAGDEDYYMALGYARDDIVGVDGAEKAFDTYLHGSPGVKRVEQNESGKIKNVLYSKDPEPGENVYLTLDLRLQEQTERLLAEGIRDLQENGEELKGKEAEAGAAVVLDVHTSEVLALANYPTYNLASFKDDYAELLNDPLQPMFNRAISGLYSPGSTFKMITAAAGLEEGVITRNTTVYDKGVYVFYDSRPKCHIYPGSHGSVNASDAIKVSCNYFFYETGRLTAIDRLIKWAENFGLGQPTGIELPGEKSGWIAGPQTSAALNTTWYGGNILSAAIGQSDNLFTPIQICNYVAAIANGGTVNRAHLLRETKSFDYAQQTSDITPPEVLRETGASSRTLALLQDGMFRVANEQGGSAYSIFKDFPIQVAAKTGSVQSGDRPNNGVFVAYAPYDDPQIAICVVVEKGGAGSRVAPIAASIIEAWVNLQNDMETLPDENILQK